MERMKCEAAKDGFLSFSLILSIILSFMFHRSFVPNHFFLCPKANQLGDTLRRNLLLSLSKLIMLYSGDTSVPHLAEPRVSDAKMLSLWQNRFFVVKMRF
jgi:hypothetical protein